MLRLWLALLVGAVMVVGSGVVSNLAKAQAGNDPAAVITAYEMARNRRDLDAALGYFADDALITQRTTTYTGKEEIRKFLEAVSTRSRFIVVSDRHSNGNRVSWTERSGTQGTNDQQQAPSLAQGAQIRTTGITGTGVSATAGATTPAFTTGVEAVVQDGKIRSVTYLTPNQPARIDPALEGRSPLPASAGLATVGVVMAGVLVVASLSFRRRLGDASSLRGRMLPALQGWSSARQ
jgi:hypothetical protein